VLVLVLVLVLVPVPVLVPVRVPVPVPVPVPVLVLVLVLVKAQVLVRVLQRSSVVEKPLPRLRRLRTMRASRSMQPTTTPRAVERSFLVSPGFDWALETLTRARCRAHASRRRAPNSEPGASGLSAL
jgi:hypothetical protein